MNSHKKMYKWIANGKIHENIQHAINKARAVELHKIGFIALVEAEHHDARLQWPAPNGYNRRNMTSCHKETIVMIMHPLVI